MSEPFLSKSKYLIGLQCPKLLWHHYHAREELPPVDDGTRARFDQGHEVGELAKTLFPEGIDLSNAAGFDSAIEATRKALPEGKPLFEPAFKANNTFARADILSPLKSGKWNIIEVKSSTEVKDYHVEDLAFQRFCYAGVGLKIHKCLLMHINNDYVRRDEVDPRKLFHSEDVSSQVNQVSCGIESRVGSMLSAISRNKCPEVDIGPHCGDPFPCPLRDKCWKAVDAEPNNIFTLYRFGQKAWPLYRRKIIRNADIPSSHQLTQNQWIQIEAEDSGRPHIDKARIREFLGQLEPPLHFLDFETFQTAIPLVEGTRPYQQIPFQFSLQIAEDFAQNAISHSWLWDGKGDPRETMLKEMKRVIKPRGSIVAYNASFERSRLNEAVAAHRRYAPWIQGVLSRFIDLLSPFRSFDIYYPAQHGSASIKAVLPALTGRGYEKLAIRDGSEASEEFKRITFTEVNPTERRRVREDLEAYCGLDTRGMVDIVARLRELAWRDRGSCVAYRPG